MNLRALLIFVVCGISGAIVGWGVSWLTELGIGVIIGVAIGSGLCGLIFSTEKSKETQLMEDLNQIEVLNNMRNDKK